MGPILAILWAQWRVSANYLRRANKAGVAMKWISSIFWYGSWATAAVGIGVIASGRLPTTALERILPVLYFFLFFFWQLFPIVMASQGAYIDMRRLLVYPIPRTHLFWLEVLLRVSTGFEMLLIHAGLLAGLMFNEKVPGWAPFVVIGFALFNLLLATALKSALTLLFQKKGVREVVMVLFLGAVIAPQFLATRIEADPSGSVTKFREIARLFNAVPWTAAAKLTTGWSAGSLAALLAWIGASYLAARVLFERTLAKVDSGGAPVAKPEPAPGTLSFLDRFATLPSKLLLDPLGALVEKDLRTLSRSARFRLIFLMASTLGTALWLPQAISGRGGWIANNFMTLGILYGMLVLGEVIYWNVFGFERAGAQHWFVTPLDFRTVLRAKNVVAVVVTGLSGLVLTAFALVFPVKVGPAEMADAFVAAAVCLTFVLGGGNLTSVYMPKPIDGEQAWRNQSSKTQFLLLFVYPFLFFPVTMAYLARWGTGNYWAYHGVMAAVLLAALCFYSVATESAAEAAALRKEQIVSALSQKEGPVSLSS